MLATFALGTAAGDLTAVTFGLGYFGSILLFAGDHRDPGDRLLPLRLNSILAFWFAYVVTRPLGASVADWLAVSSARGGLALGTGPVSLVFAAAIAGFVYHLSKTGKDTPPTRRGPPCCCWPPLHWRSFRTPLLASAPLAPAGGARLGSSA